MENRKGMRLVLSINKNITLQKEAGLPPVYLNGIVKTIDDDCEEQVPSVTFIYNIGQHWS